jgi:hypothetical protein
MDTATSQYAPGDLRVSDADRDRAVAQLSEHYQAGRLTLEEFDERSGQALQAKTARELTGLFSDLPASPASTVGPVSVPESGPHLPVARVVVAAVAVSAIALVVAVLSRTGIGHHHGFVVPVLPLFVVFFVLRRLAWRRWRRDGAIPSAPVQDR